MSLKAVKNKIKSIDKTRKVTKAMEAVSAVKMRKSQALALSTRPYATSAMSILRNISGATEAVNHPLMTERPVKRTLIVVVSADKGLAGSYGTALLKGVHRFMAEKKLTQENTALVCVGKKAYEHFHKRGWTIVDHYERWSDQVTFETVRPIAEKAKESYLKSEYDQVFIVYTNFISTLRQTVNIHRLLPVTFESVREVVAGITPEHGKFSDIQKVTNVTPVKEYTLEPSADEVLTQLIPVLFNIQVYHSILEANASEHSARMLAMKNASDNAGDISRGLKLHFNKVRQAAITREVSEIVGGMESMRVVDV